MLKYENGGLKNQLAPRNQRPRFNKALLIINIVLVPCALVVAVFDFYYEEPVTAVAMLLVAIICLYNAVMAWKALRQKKQEP